MASSKKRQNNPDKQIGKNPTDTPPPLAPKTDADEAIAKHDAVVEQTPPSSHSASVVAPGSGWLAPPLSGKDKGQTVQGESSDIFTNDRKRGNSNLHAGMPTDTGDQSHLFGPSNSESESGSPSDILSDSLAFGESDVLHSMLGLSGLNMSDSASRASSVFTDPANATEPIEMPVLRPGEVNKDAVAEGTSVPLFDEDEIDADDEDDGAVDIGPPRANRFKNEDDEGDQESGADDATDMMPRPQEDVEVDDFTHELFGNDEDSGVSLNSKIKTGNDSSLTSASPRPENEDDIFSDKTMAEFDVGTPSGLNLLDPDISASKIHTVGPSSGLDLLNPNAGGSASGITTGSSGPKSGIYGPSTKSRVAAPSRALASGQSAGPVSGKIPKADKSGTHSSMITSEELTKDVRTGPGGSDLFADPAHLSNQTGHRSSILPGAASDAVSFDMPDNRIKQPERLRGYEGSGLIDWSEGMGMIDSDQLSQRMTLDENENEYDDEDATEHELEIDVTAAIMADKARGVIPESKPMSSVVRVNRLGAESATTLKNQSTTLNRRSENQTKTTPKLKPQARGEKAKSGGMLVGATLGLFGSAAVVAVAYFGGLIGPNNDKKALARENELIGSVAILREQVATRTVDSTKFKGQLDAAIAEKTRESAEKVRIALEKDKTDKELANVKRSVTALSNEKTNLAKERDLAKAEAKTLAAAVEEAKNGLVTVQADLQAKDKSALEAQVNLANATAQLKTADAALDTVVKELQSANLLDPKLDRTAAMKELPVAIKKASETGFVLPVSSAAIAGAATPAGQLMEYAKRASLAREEATKTKALALAEKTKADKELADAKDNVATVTATLTKKITALEKSKDKDVADAVALVKKQFEASLAMAKVENDRLADDKLNTVALYERRMADQTEQFRKDVAAARAGVLFTVNDADRRVADKATKLAGDGLAAYFEARYADAETALTTATQSDPADARSWYFLGLAQFAQGKVKPAESAFKTGAEWEARNAPSPRQIGIALERVQGPARTALDAHRP